MTYLHISMYANTSGMLIDIILPLCLVFILFHSTFISLVFIILLFSILECVVCGTFAKLRVL